MMSTRRYDIDALRTIAFLLLIFYHVGMFYVADWGWHIKSQYQSDWLKFPMLLVNQWRMPLLFVISGIATHFLLRKRTPPTFLASRSQRLLIPFVVGVLLIIPPQAYLQALDNGTLAQAYAGMSYGEFLLHYFTFQGWPEGAFDGSDYGFTWNHLWFIPYLFFYTLLIIPVRYVLRISRLDKLFPKVGTFGILVIPIVCQLLWKVIFTNRDVTHALIDDGYAHALFFSYFLLGYLISDKFDIWKSILALRWIALGSAIFTYSNIIVLWWGLGDFNWKPQVAMVLSVVNQWLWLLAIMGWAAHLFNRPHQWVRFANDRVYAWYIFHQTLTIIAGFYLSPYKLGGILESTLVTFFTVAGCLVLTEWVIGQKSWLALLFGKKMEDTGKLKAVKPSVVFE